jgi:hypothetical protein
MNFLKALSDQLADVKVEKNDEIKEKSENNNIAEEKTVEPTKMNKFIIGLKNYIKDFNVLKKIEKAGAYFILFFNVSSILFF